jgi:nicotinate-nucleotide pyrophosphorylase (carboxylating)
MSRPRLEPLDPELVERAVQAALAEDLGAAGDITTDAIVPESASGRAEIVARTSGVIAGLALAEASFRAFDPAIDFRSLVDDGASVSAGKTVARIGGRAGGMLSAERTALNFLGHLSGIATLTRRFVEAVAGTGAKIADTRKTLPGLRALEKYAVRAGGGVNHRFGLYDAVLIKDNHIEAAGGVSQALSGLSQLAGKFKLEIEVETLAQLEEALQFPIDAVLLDNMELETMREAVRRAKGRVLTEASGGVTLETVHRIAETGVDWISVGALTHSPKNLDLALEWTGSS